MEILIITGGIVVSYVVFIMITCWVARMMFPKIEIKEEDLVDIEDLKKLKAQLMRRSRSRAQEKAQSWLRSAQRLESNPQLWQKV